MFTSTSLFCGTHTFTGNPFPFVFINNTRDLGGISAAELEPAGPETGDKQREVA